MAYSQTIKLVSGDTLPTLTVRIKDASTAAAGAVLDPEDSTTWNPVSLVGSTVVMRVRRVGDTTIVDAVAGTLTDAANGVVQFSWTPASLATAGLFEAEFEVTTSGGGVFTIYDLLKIDVRDDF